MNRTLTRLAVLVGLLAPAGAFAQHPSEFTVRDKCEIFIQHVVKFMKVDPSQYRAMVLEYEIGIALAEATQDHDHQEGCIHERVGMSANFIENALVELHPAYREAKEHVEGGRTNPAREALASVRSSLDPYVSAHAKLLAARLAFEAGEYDRVIELCEEITLKDRVSLLDDHVACELIAKCFEKQSRPLLELAQLSILVVDYAEIPDDTRSRAETRMQELSQQVGKPLQKVAGWMNYVEKALQEEVTGEPTQEQEREIVTALDKLIELQEAKERNACGG